MSELLQAVPARSESDSSSSNRAILTAAKGGGVLFFGKLFSYASRFVFGVIAARALGAAQFGMYNLSSSMALLLSGVALLGMPFALVRFLPIALGKRDEDAVWGIIQAALALVGIVSVVLGLVAFGFANLIAEIAFHEPALAPLIRIASVSIPLIALSRTLIAATQGFKHMEYQVYSDLVLFNVAKVGLTVLFLVAGSGVSGIVTATVLAWSVEFVLLLYFLNRLFSLRRPLSAAQRNTRELLSFSFPVYLSRIVGRFEDGTDIMVLGILGTVAWVGVYNVASRIQVIGIMFLLAIQTAANPLISDLHSRGQNAQLEQLYQTITKWSLAFTLPFFLTVAMFSTPILSIFGKEFEDGSLALIILALGTLVNGATGNCASIITMTGYAKLKLVNALISTVILIGLDLLLIPRWGLVGSAIATGLAVTIMNILQTIQVHKLLKLWPYTRTIFKPIIAGLAALVLTFVLNQAAPGTGWMYLVLKVAFLWLCYTAATILLGLTEEDHMILKKVQKRLGTKLGRAATT